MLMTSKLSRLYWFKWVLISNLLKAYQAHVFESLAFWNFCDTKSWWQRKCFRHSRNYSSAIELFRNNVFILIITQGYGKGFRCAWSLSHRVSKDREKHVAKPQRVLTASNRTAVSWGRVETSRFPPSAVNPHQLAPLSLSVFLVFSIIMFRKIFTMHNKNKIICN